MWLIKVSQDHDLVNDLDLSLWSEQRAIVRAQKRRITEAGDIGHQRMLHLPPLREGCCQPLGMRGTTESKAKFPQKELYLVEKTGK